MTMLRIHWAERDHQLDLERSFDIATAAIVGTAGTVDMFSGSFRMCPGRLRARLRERNSLQAATAYCRGPTKFKYQAIVASSPSERVVAA